MGQFMACCMQDESIEQVTIGDGGTFETPGALLDGTTLQALGPKIDKIVGSFEHYGVHTFAGIKDLVILCVLFRTGGMW